MPPSWTDVTDPNVAFDTKGRVYQTTLPFNAFWGGSTLHPDGAIDVSYSDDMGQHWVKGNGGQDLEQSPNASAKQAGHVEDKQWIAVNDIVGSPNQDHVYAMWSVFNSSTTKIRIAVSRDRGQTFSKAVTITAPNQTGPSNTYIYPSIDDAGTLYIAFASFPQNGKTSTATLYVSHSSDDGQTFAPFVAAATAGTLSAASLPNTTFRDGITENFTASPDVSRPPLPHLRELGRHPDGRQVHPVDRRRHHLVGAGDGERQRRRPRRPDSSVPAVGGRRACRRGRRRVGRPPRQRPAVAGRLAVL